MTCWKYNRSGSNGKPRVVRHPSSCVTLRPEDPLANYGKFTRLRWKHWGRSSATTTGYSYAAHGDYKRGRVVFPRYRARLRASGITEFGGKRWYTKLRVTTRFGTGTYELDPPSRR